MTTEFSNAWYELPIREIIPQLIEGLAEGHVVLAAPPGSGKTTGVPPALLGCDWLAGRKILMLEPRRPAARMAARRIAALLDEPLGRRVGYQIRFERKGGRDTRIEIVTEGVLTRRLQQDPELNGVGLVIFDEFHERNLQADLALALCLDVCALREDLRLLVMSATLADDEVDRLLSARRVTASGRSYPVELLYLPEPRRGQTASGFDLGRIAGLIQAALTRRGGDLLVFLPGRREIEQLKQQLAGALSEADSGARPGAEVLPLYGDLSSEAQDRVLLRGPGSIRRIILATDIAETSLTVPGVEVVIDSGLARKPDFDPNTGLTRLQTVRIAQDSATQRAGRAGRTAPGACYRAWSEHEQRRLAVRTPAEILNADLAPLALELARWGVADPSALAWLDPPPAAHWSQAVALLRQLEAVDDKGRLTAQGRQMAELPVHPRLARLLIRAGRGGRYALACDLAALLSERDPLRAGEGDRFGVDLGARIEALQEMRAGSVPSGFDRARLRRIERIARQLSDLGRTLDPVTGPASSRMSVAGLISLAYPDRIAKAGATPGRFTLVSGRQVRLPDADRLSSADWLVVPQLDGGRREARAWLATSLDHDELMELHGHRTHTSGLTDWHPQSGAVRVRHERRLGQLVLDTEYRGEADPQAVLERLIAEIDRQGLELLNWTVSARRLQARSEQYRQLLESGDWPDLSERWLQEHLYDWLAPWLGGVDSLPGLRKVDLVAVLNGLLGWQRVQQLEQSMPLRLTTPAGTQREIEYRTNGPPTLSVRMQEMYGMSETPRIANGRLRLVLHLLSPANRVLQITQDLGHFWSDGYREVRKEMRSRYPKHYWPEDPSTAQATSRVKRHL